MIIMGFAIQKALAFRKSLDNPSLTVRQRQRAIRNVKHYTAIDYAYKEADKRIKTEKLLKGKRPEECINIVRQLRESAYCAARAKLDGDRYPSSRYKPEFSQKNS